MKSTKFKVRSLRTETKDSHVVTQGTVTMSHLSRGSCDTGNSPRVTREGFWTLKTSPRVLRSRCRECHDAGFGVAGRGAGGTVAAIGDGDRHAHIAAALAAEAGDLDHAGGKAFSEGRGTLPGIEVDDQHILGSQGLGILILDGQIPDLQLCGIRTVQIAGFEGLGDLRLLQRAIGRAEDVAGDFTLPVQFRC